METIHSAIAWYQKKIGSYDKQLWEQSVEKKLQKGLPNVHHAPRKTVRLKTEYIDVDLIRGSTFTKTKPQVPWIYITRKAFVRVLFFPFYYRWWVLQSSRKVYYLLLTLYLFQVITAFIYFWNLDGSVIEDELTLTEVVVPIGLMFLLGLIHSQTVLAHFSLKPPRPMGRHGSKQKKRQRQGTSLPTRDVSDVTDRSATHHAAGVDSVRDSRHFKEMSPSRPHRRTTSLWNVPRVEISAAEVTTTTTPQHTSSPQPSLSQPCCSSARQPCSSPSALRQNCSQTRAGTRNAKRAEKKNARIIIIDGDTACSQDNGQLQTVQQPSSSSLITVKAAALEDSFDVEPHCENLDSVDLEEVNGTSAGVDTVGPGLIADGSKGAGQDGSNQCGSGMMKAADTDRSSSGIDDVYDDGTPFAEGSTGQPLANTDTATTDSDSLAGRFVMVHMDSVDKEAPANASPSKPAASPRSYHHSHHPHRSCPSRSSFSEDGGVTDHRDEENMSENLSDTGGHVSNSSNYNPSDSGSEGNCDDGDTVGMPVPLTNPPSSSSSSTATATMDSEVVAAGAGGGAGSAGPANLLLSNSTPSPTHPATLPSSPRKQGHPAAQREGEESSASDPGSPDPRQNSSALRRRRRASANQTAGGGGGGGGGGGVGGGATEPGGDRGAENVGGSGGGIRPRPLLPKLLGLRAQSKVTQTSGISSSDNEAGHLTPEGVNKATISSEEWEDRMQSDVTTSSSYSTSNSDSELSENANIEDENEENPLAQDCLPHGAFHGINLLQPPSSSNPALHSAQPDKVSCMIWEVNECKKLDLTALDIGWAIIDKVDNLPESSDYIFIGVALSLCLGCVPFVFRLFTMKVLPGETTYQVWLWLWAICQKNSWGQNLIMVNGILQRLALSCIFFFLLTVTDRTFKQRLLYAKHFSYLTSSRRARKFDMPHFRLNKVRNIKIWLSLRSYLKRRGPQRSVDVIVSASFYLTISLICLMCIQMLKDSDTYLDYLCNWELIVWCLALGIYIMRFMTLGLKINKKYRNLSVLITEQINLYLQMEQKPHKKEELTLANNVLRLAEDLLKELESPFKISGFSANPLIYNITKVVVLSAFSAVLTEVLGFKLKLYKIKLK